MVQGFGLLLAVLCLGSAPSIGYAATVERSIVFDRSGVATIDGVQRLTVQPGVDVDMFTWVVLDSIGQSVDQLRITVQLPVESRTAQLTHQLLVINGVETYTSQFVDGRTVLFEATGVGPQATASVVMNFPKGYFSLPPIQATSSAIQSMNPVWLGTSVLLPLLGLLLLAWMLIARARDRWVPKGAATVTPPAAVPPALVSILYENKIEPEAIAATLIDLGRRGYLSIFNKGDNFIFAKEREINLATSAFEVGMHEVELSTEELKIAKDEGLEPFEKILLSKLFVSDRPISSKEDVKVRIGHGMFSKKVAAIYEYLFRAASALGYFVPNAIRLHRRYLLTGWFLFALGVVGFAAGAWFLPDPKYFLLFWAGLIALAYVIVQLAPYVPVRTGAGRTTLGQFLVYRSSLVAEEPAGKEAGIDEFFDGLAYAWAMRAEGQWAKRYKDVVFHRPTWYFASKELKSTTELVADLTPLVEFVAQSFAAVRQKTLD
jgi:hypothetical protein